MNSELYHHGVLGMKWGVRRYQPYPKGERVKGGKEVGQAAKVQQRVGNTASKSKYMESKSSENQNEKKTSSSNKKPNEMTKEELQAAVDRLNLEKKYMELFKELNPQPKKVKKGESTLKKLAGEILYSSVKDVGTQASKYVMGAAINKAFKKAGAQGIPVNIYGNQGPKDKDKKK